MFILYVLVVIALVLSAVSLALQGGGQAPPTADQTIDIPTAEEGREIPVLFGTKVLKGVNILWSGDIELTPIKSAGGKK